MGRGTVSDLVRSLQEIPNLFFSLMMCYFTNQQFMRMIVHKDLTSYPQHIECLNSNGNPWLFKGMEDSIVIGFTDVTPKIHLPIKGLNTTPLIQRCLTSKLEKDMP